MRRAKKRALIAMALCAAAAVGPAAADGTSSPQGEMRYSHQEAATFSKALERELASQGARVAIVFRAGRSREALPRGVDYTHGAFWVYQDIKTEDGERVRGYVTHNLYHGDGDTLPATRSYLAEDFPLAFVSPAHEGDFGVIVPTPEMQRRILVLMASGAYSDLHVPDYSMIANPLDDQFQNCTEFMLDVVAAAAWETTDYPQLKANLGAHFEPTELKISPLERLFGPAVDGRLSTADHRRSPVRTATYRSLAVFMTGHGLADRAYAFDPNDQTNPTG